MAVGVGREGWRGGGAAALSQMCTCVTGLGLQRQKGLLLITTEILKKKKRKKNELGGGSRCCSDPGHSSGWKGVATEEAQGDHADDGRRK